MLAKDAQPSRGGRPAVELRGGEDAATDRRADHPRQDAGGDDGGSRPRGEPADRHLKRRDPPRGGKRRRRPLRPWSERHAPPVVPVHPPRQVERFEANARREARIELMRATLRPGEDLQELARQLTTGGRAEVVLVGEEVASSRAPRPVRRAGPAVRRCARRPARGHGSSTAGRFLVIARRMPAPGNGWAMSSERRQRVEHRHGIATKT